MVWAGRASNPPGGLLLVGYLLGTGWVTFLFSSMISSNDPPPLRNWGVPATPRGVAGACPGRGRGVANIHAKSLAGFSAVCTSVWLPLSTVVDMSHDHNHKACVAITSHVLWSQDMPRDHKTCLVITRHCRQVAPSEFDENLKIQPKSWVNFKHIST